MVRMAIVTMNPQESVLQAKRQVWIDVANKLPHPDRVLPPSREAVADLEGAMARRLRDLLGQRTQQGRDPVLRLRCPTPEAQLLLRLARED